MGPRQGYGGRVIRSVARFAWTMAAQRQRHLHRATENTTPIFFPVEEWQRVQPVHGLGLLSTSHRILQIYEILLSV
jgi:hypothetical protein